LSDEYCRLAVAAIEGNTAEQLRIQNGHFSKRTDSTIGR
jgi:hypothetical protein